MIKSFFLLLKKKQDNEEDESSHDKYNEELNLHPPWQIGVVVDNNGLLDTKEAHHLWIGPIVENILGSESKSNAFGSSKSNYLLYFAITIMYMYYL